MFVVLGDVYLLEEGTSFGQIAVLHIGQTDEGIYVQGHQAGSPVRRCHIHIF